EKISAVEDALASSAELKIEAEESLDSPIEFDVVEDASAPPIDNIANQILASDVENEPMANEPESRPEPPKSDDLQETLNWLEELALYDTEGILRVPRDGAAETSSADAVPEVESSASESVELPLPSEELSDAVGEELDWLDDVSTSDFDLDEPQQIEESPTVRWEEESRASVFRPAMPSEGSEVAEGLEGLVEESSDSADDFLDEVTLGSTEDVAPEISDEDALFDELLDSGLEEDFSSTNLFDEANVQNGGQAVVEEESDSLLAWINADTDDFEEVIEDSVDESAPLEMGLEDLIPPLDSEPEPLDEPEVAPEPEPEPEKPAKKQAAPSLFGGDEEFHVSEAEIAHAVEHGEEVAGFDIPDDPDSLMAWLNMDIDVSDSTPAEEAAEPDPIVDEAIDEIVDEVVEAAEPDLIVDEVVDEVIDGVVESAVVDDEVDAVAEEAVDESLIQNETLSEIAQLPDDPDEALKIIEELSQGDLPDVDEDDQLLDLIASVEEDGDGIEEAAAATAEESDKEALDEPSEVFDDIFADSPVETTGAPFDGMASEYLFGDLNKGGSSELDWLDDMTFDSDPALLGEIPSPRPQVVPPAEEADPVAEALSADDESEITDSGLESILNWDETLDEIGDQDIAELGLFDDDDDLDVDVLAEVVEESAGPEAAAVVEAIEDLSSEDLSSEDVLSEDVSNEDLSILDDVLSEIEEPAEEADLLSELSLESDFSAADEGDDGSIEDWLKSDADSGSGLDWLDDGDTSDSMNWLTQEEQASHINPLRSLDTAMLDESILKSDPIQSIEPPRKEEPADERVTTIRPQYLPTPPDEQDKGPDVLPSSIAPKPKLETIPKMLTSELNNYRIQIKQGENLPGLIEELESSVAQKDDPRLCQILGDAYMKVGELQSALDAYRKAQRMLQ
ncbi:MAG: hypothetical protein AAF633_21370, partial [Chloroflexota bacterium]